MSKMNSGRKGKITPKQMVFLAIPLALDLLAVHFLLSSN